jgi:glycosyltransferase involved in cell wall biosynthesis
MIGPRVSVIIPCFNARQTIAETVQSALCQTFRDFEILVIDDGSTDESADVIRGFGNAVRAEFGPNRGASAARNRGTALARGAFIQYLDSDDLLTPNALERRLAALETSGADVAYGDWQRFEIGPDGARHDGDIVARVIEDVDSDPEIACATQFWAPPAALLYRRTIVEAIGSWNERLPVIQDARFLFDAAYRGARFVRVAGVSAYYRVAPGTLSRRDDRKFMLDLYRNGCEIQALWQAKGPLSNKRKQALASIFDNAARGLFRFGAAEFEDAAMRYIAVSSRRMGYPAIALRLSELMGRDLAGIVLDRIMRVTGPLRRAIGSN